MSTLGFEVDWYDSCSQSVQRMFLKFFIDDNTLELVTGTKTFLKRIHYPQLMNISRFNRVFTIKKYANSATEAYMRQREVHFLVVIGDRDMPQVYKVFDAAKENQLRVARVKPSSTSVLDIMEPNDVAIEFAGLSEGRSDSFLLAIDSIGSSARGFQMAVDEIEACFKHCTPIQIPEECTLCIIKPHILKQCDGNGILKSISQNGFSARSLFSFHFTMPIAEELFDVYRGVYPTFNKMVEHMSSGIVLCVLVTSKRNPATIVSDFREVCGPLDPELATTLRPQSIRALYGRSIVENAVHCTDLDDDGFMEGKFVFETLAQL